LVGCRPVLWLLLQLLLMGCLPLRTWLLLQLLVLLVGC